MIIIVEFVAKLAKINISILDNIYDCKENIENDELNPNNWPDVLAKKNYTIDQQEIKIKSLEKKIGTLEEIPCHNIQ